MRIHENERPAPRLSSAERRRAALLQGGILLAHVGLLALEYGLVRWLGGAVGLAAMLLAVVLDWWLVSPLLLARDDWFFYIAATWQPGCLARLQACFDGTDPTHTQEFCLPNKAPISLRKMLVKHYRHPLRAVGWRLKRWELQLRFSILYYAPAFVLLTFYPHIPLMAGGTWWSAIWNALPLLCAALGVLLIPIGWCCVQLRMLRYLPASYLLAAGCPLRGCFRLSRKLTRRQTEHLLQFHLHHLPMLLCGVLIVPYVWNFPSFYYARTQIVLHLPERDGIGNIYHARHMRTKQKRLIKG